MAVSLTAAKTSTATTKSGRTEAAAKAAARIEDASASEYTKWVVYARNKVGKTKFACSSDLPTLVIDCNERGSASVRKRPNVKVYKMRTWEDLDPIFWYLKTEDHPFKGGVIVIDTVTMLAMIGMKWVLKDDYDRDMNRDPMSPDRRSWGKLGEMLKDAIIKFRNLEDVHVIFLAQEKTSTSDDEDGGTIIETHPELSPSPRSTLLSSVDIIGRLYTKEVEVTKGGVTTKRMERRMLLGTHPKFVSGNRYDELKAIERIPVEGGLQLLLNKINGETSADTQ